MALYGGSHRQVYSFTPISRCLTHLTSTDDSTNEPSIRRCVLCQSTQLGLSVHSVVHGHCQKTQKMLFINNVHYLRDCAVRIVFGLTSLTSSDYFQFSSSTNTTRGHAYKLYISQNSCNIRRKVLPCRILIHSQLTQTFHRWRLLDERCFQLTSRNFYIVITI